MYKVGMYLRVRRACFVEGMSAREAARVFGLHRDTVRKMLKYSVPPGYRRERPAGRPKLDPYKGVIDQILEVDQGLLKKQRHTAKRIYERLRDEHGFPGKYTIVKDYVRERSRRTREMFVPLSHPPGHAQCDYGEALVIIGGVQRKAHYFAMDLPHSDGCYVKAYPAETTESFCDGHVSAFAFLGGVPQSIVYDNTTLAVAKILGDGRRRRTRVFSELQSHYLFEDRFGRPGKGNDKGKVEGLVGYVRRNFLVPIPSFESFDALNAHLEQQCLRRFEARLRGHSETIGKRLERDLEALLPLPAVPYDASDKHPTRVSSLSLVRYRTNDYSVPVAYGHRDVLVRGYVHEVVISCGSEVIARHRRSYERDDFIFDPLHYLPLLEQKTGALDQAAPLAGWELPGEFDILRRLLESRMGKRGKREFVQVLRLMENFRKQEVHSAVQDALRLGAVSFDAIKHLVLCRIEGRPPRLDMGLYPYLPRANVATTSTRDYMTLLVGSRS
jgi:transposase